MNTNDNTGELKTLIKKVKIESPDPDFTSRVMKVILADVQKEKVFSSEPVLGRSFWILVMLFVLLIVFFILISGYESPDNGVINDLLSGFPVPDLTPLNNSLVKIMEKTGSIPVSVTMTMIATTVLILADRFFYSKQKLIPG
jgi:hypothetical protein